MSQRKEELLGEVKKAFSEVVGVDETQVCVKRALDAGATPVEVSMSMILGLEEVGRRYERSEYFLSELIMAGVMATEVSTTLKPSLTAQDWPSLGKVVIGTVRGDVHDIGKNIIISMLTSAGITVVDLGVDVSAEKFVEAVRTERPDILALSCLLSIAVDQMKNVMDQLNFYNLRQNVKVIVGGRPIDRNLAEQIGADGYAEDAIEALKEFKRLITKPERELNRR